MSEGNRLKICKINHICCCSVKTLISNRCWVNHKIRKYTWKISFIAKNAKIIYVKMEISILVWLSLGSVKRLPVLTAPAKWFYTEKMPFKIIHILPIFTFSALQEAVERQQIKWTCSLLRILTYGVLKVFHDLWL